MTKEIRDDLLRCFWGRLSLFFIVPIILLIISSIDIIFECGIDTGYVNLLGEFFDYIQFSEDTMQNIWGIQLTITTVVTTICVIFFDKAHERRLGLSFKYLFFHNSIFGKNNVFYLTIMNIFSLICGGTYAYLLIGISHVMLQQGIKLLFVLNLGIQIWQTLRMLDLFAIARYKESVIYRRIRELLEKGNENVGTLTNKFIEGAPIDYRLSILREDYNQYFVVELYTLYTFFIKSDKQDIIKELVLKSISAKIYQREKILGKEYISLYDEQEFKNNFAKLVGHVEDKDEKGKEKVKKLLSFVGENSQEIIGNIMDIRRKQT